MCRYSLPSLNSIHLVPYVAPKLSEVPHTLLQNPFAVLRCDLLNEDVRVAITLSELENLAPIVVQYSHASVIAVGMKIRLAQLICHFPLIIVHIDLLALDGLIVGQAKIALVTD
jgi:hypothetical protein